MLKIDMHTHIIPEHLPKWTEKFGYGDFIHLQHHKKGAAMMMKGNKFLERSNPIVGIQLNVLRSMRNMVPKCKSSAPSQ